MLSLPTSVGRVTKPLFKPPTPSTSTFPPLHLHPSLSALGMEWGGAGGEVGEGWRGWTGGRRAVEEGRGGGGGGRRVEAWRVGLRWS